MKYRTTDSTNTLKGIAIIAVLINHYLNINVSGNFVGFANVWLVIFFMLSGYGNEHSLSRIFKYQDEPLTCALIFYYQRIIRIFPLFWLAYILECLLFKKQISILTLLGYHASGHFWFVPALLQCYLIAPLVHILINKNRTASLILIIAVFVLSNMYLRSTIAPDSLLPVLKDMHVYWRNVYFLYIFIFSLSMLVPKAISQWHEISSREKAVYFYLLATLVMAFMIFVKYRPVHPYLFNISTQTLVPMLVIIVAAIYLICNRISIPFVKWIGSISYSIYLFHLILYFSINKYFRLGKDSLAELCLVFMFFPLFLYGCSKLEQLSDHFVKALKNRSVSP